MDKMEGALRGNIKGQLRGSRALGRKCPSFGLSVPHRLQYLNNWDGLLKNLVQIFKIPRGWILKILDDFP